MSYPFPPASSHLLPGEAGGGTPPCGRGDGKRRRVGGRTVVISYDDADARDYGEGRGLRCVVPFTDGRRTAERRWFL
jgi:hypothetical protein